MKKQSPEFGAGTGALAAAGQQALHEEAEHRWRSLRHGCTGIRQCRIDGHRHD